MLCALLFVTEYRLEFIRIKLQLSAFLNIVHHSFVLLLNQAKRGDLQSIIRQTSIDSESKSESESESESE